jgi:hypothetical protein
MLRLELELPSGLTVRARLTKEEYSQLGLAEDQRISFEIRQYRVLTSESGFMQPELQTDHAGPPSLGEGI